MEMPSRFFVEVPFLCTLACLFLLRKFGIIVESVTLDTSNVIVFAMISVASHIVYAQFNDYGTNRRSGNTLPSPFTDSSLSIAIVGLGPMGRFVADLYQRGGHRVICINRRDEHYDAHRERYNMLELERLQPAELSAVDVIIMAVSISSLQQVLQAIPAEVFAEKLVLDMCSVKVLEKKK